jgi:polysaccharide export outer membrane protein
MWKRCAARGAAKPERRCGVGIGWLGAIVVVLAGLAPTGCQKEDARISISELMVRERELADTPDIAVQPADLKLTDAQPYRVSVGDVLRLTLTGLKEDRYADEVLNVRVHKDGQIRLPLVGAVRAEGLELGEIEQAVIEAHVPDVVRELSVFVELAGPESTTVLVMGAVALPGLVKLPQNERNVLYALVQAGGFGGQTSGTVRLRPIQPERMEAVYDLNDVNDVRRAMMAPPLQSGDIIVADGQSQSAVYVSGLANAPGPIIVPPNSELSMVRAIAASGGLVDFLEPKEATLWRVLDDGEQVRVKVNLEAVMAGEAPDLALRPGDVLDIPHTSHTRFRQWFAQNIQIGPFGVTAMYDPVADYRARILRNDNQDNNAFRQTLLQSLGSGLSDLVIPAPVP